MNDIPSKKVSPDRAKAVFNVDTAPPPTSPRKEDRTLDRAPAGAEIDELTAATFTWLSQLPKEKRPNALARQFPHVANKLAALWKRPLHCELYLDDLVLDLRGGRRGFPPRVAEEIAVLKTYFTTEVAPVRYDVWGERIGMTE
jgi:hypothetical protein